MSKLADDPRLDSRIKAVFGRWPTVEQQDAASREEMLSALNSEEATAGRDGFAEFVERCDTEEVAPRTASR